VFTQESGETMIRWREYLPVLRPQLIRVGVMGNVCIDSRCVFGPTWRPCAKKEFVRPASTRVIFGFFWREGNPHVPKVFQFINPVVGIDDGIDDSLTFKGIEVVPGKFRKMRVRVSECFSRYSRHRLIGGEYDSAA
jgi:hypothetical protein